MREDLLYLFSALVSAVIVGISYWILIRKKEGFRMKIGDIFVYWFAGAAIISYLLMKIFTR